MYVCVSCMRVLESCHSSRSTALTLQHQHHTTCYVYSPTHSATHCNSLQLTATHCNIPCNTRQHTATPESHDVLCVFVRVWARTYGTVSIDLPLFKSTCVTMPHTFRAFCVTWLALQQQWQWHTFRGVCVTWLALQQQRQATYSSP